MTLHVPADLSHSGPVAMPVDLVQADRRVDWVDHAKGWTILLVVLMHATLGVGAEVAATGWTHEIVRFAKPFRMPDFFFVAGLFAGAAATQSWQRFFDRRVLHFAYFYGLWAVLLISLRAMGGEAGTWLPALLKAVYDPYSSLWFIYVLPLMFLTLRLAARLPAGVVLAGAMGFHLLAARHEDGGAYMLAVTWSGNTAIDSYLMFVVFFLCGHYARDHVFRFAGKVRAHPAAALAALAVWGALNGLATRADWLAAPGALFLTGLVGAFAVITMAVLLSRLPLFGWLGLLGRHSLVIYLAYAVPLAVVRELAVRSGLVSDTGTIAALATTAAIVTPILLHRLTKGTSAGVFFERPAWARIVPANR